MSECMYVCVPVGVYIHIRVHIHLLFPIFVSSLLLTSLHFTSPHSTSLHSTSLHFTPPHLITLHFNSLHLTSPQFTSPTWLHSPHSPHLADTLLAMTRPELARLDHPQPTSNRLASTRPASTRPRSTRLFPDIIFYQISFIDLFYRSKEYSNGRMLATFFYFFFSPVGMYSTDNCPGFQVLHIITLNSFRVLCTRVSWSACLGVLRLSCSVLRGSARDGLPVHVIAFKYPT